MASISVTPKKRGRPATGKNPPVNVRLPPAMLEALDRATKERADDAGRSDLVRAIIRDWLIGHGYLPHEST